MDFYGLAPSSGICTVARNPPGMPVFRPFGWPFINFPERRILELGIKKLRTVLNAAVIFVLR